MADEITTRAVPVKVRHAQPADAEMLAQLGKRTFLDSFGSENTPQNMSLYLAKAFNVATITSEISDPNVTYLVGEIDERPAAYAMVRAVEAPPLVTGASPLELVRFYVDRPWHGQGVAQTLMAAAVETARSGGARTLWLGVWERNERAIAFYRKSSFADVGTQTFVLGTDHQRDLVLARPLD